MSTLTNLFGASPVWFDPTNVMGVAAAFTTSSVIDSATTSSEKIGMVGRIRHPTRPAGTFKIRKVGFRCGALTFNILSTVRVSLQDIDLVTNASPYKPDGTQDQTYDFSLGTGLTANDWNWTGNLSGDRTVSPGDRLVVVIQFTTFTALDSIIISALSTTPSNVVPTAGLGGQNIFQADAGATTWSLTNLAQTNIAFQCDDGSYAFFEGCPAVSQVGTTTVANNVTARAAGNLFTVPVEMKIDTLGLRLSQPNGCDFTGTLFDGDGTTALFTEFIDNDVVAAASSPRWSLFNFAPITLQPSTNYRFVAEGSSATSGTVAYSDVNAAGLLDSFALGSQCYYTERDSGGSWAQTTTRRAHMAFGMSGIHDGAGGGGGGGPLIDGGRLVA